jgi:hypothetical protein
MGVQFASASVSQPACPQSSPIALIKVGFIGIALKGKVLIFGVYVNSLGLGDFPSSALIAVSIGFFLAAAVIERGVILPAAAPVSALAIWLWLPWSPSTLAWIPVLHGLQYLPFARLRSTRKFDFLIWVGLGFVLFGTHEFIKRSFPAAQLAWPILGFLIGLHLFHFAIDSFIWKSDQMKLIAKRHAMG